MIIYKYLHGYELNQAPAAITVYNYDLEKAVQIHSFHLSTAGMMIARLTLGTAITIDYSEIAIATTKANFPNITDLRFPVPDGIFSVAVTNIGAVNLDYSYTVLYTMQYNKSSKEL